MPVQTVNALVIVTQSHRRCSRPSSAANGWLLDLAILSGENGEPEHATASRCHTGERYLSDQDGGEPHVISGPASYSRCVAAARLVEGHCLHVTVDDLSSGLLDDGRTAGSGEAVGESERHRFIRRSACTRCQVAAPTETAMPPVDDPGSKLRGGARCAVPPKRCPRERHGPARCARWARASTAGRQGYRSRRRRGSE